MNSEPRSGHQDGRSELRRTSFASVIAWAIALYCSSAGHAAAPFVQTQAPGYYRMMLGDFEITALNDGVVAYPTAQVLPTASRDQIAKSLLAAGLTDPVGMSYNAFLINTGRKLVLIDTGTGGKLADSPSFRGTGRVIANLRAAGYQPEQVDEIYITHLGPDHVGGLTIGTERTFPNAILRASESEVSVFLNPDDAPAWTKSWVAFWTELFSPYMKSGRFSAFKDDVTLTPGIRALATHGHSTGHTSYVVESKGQTLIVLGDLVLMGAMQFAQPALTSAFDSDPQTAATQRQRIFKLAAEANWLIAGAHLSFPGVGHVRATNDGYQWSPTNYTIPP